MIDTCVPQRSRTVVPVGRQRHCNGKPDIQFISGMPNLCEASKCEGGCISKSYFPKAQAIKHRALQNSSQIRLLEPSQPQPSTLMTPKRHKWLVLCTRASFARMKSTSQAVQQSGRGCRL